VHDYVIVGAGSAGCVLANRLSEDPSVRVLLIEAGKRDRHPNIKIPAAFAKQFKTKLDWDLATEPEPHCDNRSLYIPRGKGLGGSSSMNAMLYVRGNPLDYEGWAAAGATGWGWDDVLPYFLRAEDNQRGDSEYHATGGPLRVEDERSPRPLTGRFLAACAEFHGSNPTSPYAGVRIDSLFPSWDSCFDPKRTARIGFTHLMTAKSHPAVASRLEDRVRRENPAYFRRCRQIHQTLPPSAW